MERDIYVDMIKKLTVLIVDDDPDILDLLSEEFKCHGHNVSTAKSGNFAIDLLKRQEFDIVLSDFRMPNGNGLSVLRFINSMENRPKFFFMSGGAEMGIRECLQEGATLFFLKPISPNFLVSQILKNHYC